VAATDAVIKPELLTDIVGCDCYFVVAGVDALPVLTDAVAYYVTSVPDCFYSSILPVGVTPVLI